MTCQQPTKRQGAPTKKDDNNIFKKVFNERSINFYFLIYNQLHMAFLSDEEMKKKYPSVQIEPGPDNTEWAEAVKSQRAEDEAKENENEFMEDLCKRLGIPEIPKGVKPTEAMLKQRSMMINLASFVESGELDEFADDITNKINIELEKDKSDTLCELFRAAAKQGGIITIKKGVATWEWDKWWRDIKYTN
jgi:hypothetical protein